MPTNPTAGDVHVSRPLSNYSEYWIQEQGGFNSLEGMTMVPVDNQFDEYWTWERADLYRDEVQEMADGAEAPDMQARVSTDTFKTRVYGLRAPITDRQRANADNELRLERGKTAALMQKMMIHREGKFHGAFIGTGIWTGVADGTPGVKWDQPTATPIADIRDRIRGIESATGLRPNRISFGAEAWDTFVDADENLGRISGGSTTNNPALVQRALVAALFEIDRVHVRRAVRNTANVGATEATDFFAGSDDVLIYHAPFAPSMETPTAGIGFNWTGLTGATPSGHRIRRFRVESRETDYIQAQSAFDYKVTAPELGAYINDVST